MNTIDDLYTELKRLSQNSNQEWDILPNEEREQFFKELVVIADENRIEFSAYCKGLRGRKEAFTRMIIYETLSDHSDRWFDFLISELKEIIPEVVRKKRHEDELRPLSTVYLERLITSDYTLYTEVIDFLISHLSDRNSTQLNLHLLSIIGVNMIGLDKKSDDFQRWKAQLESFANQSNEQIKERVHQLYNPKKNKVVSTWGTKIWSIVLIFGLFLSTFAVSLFRKTFIDIKISLGIFFGVGLLMFSISRLFRQKWEMHWLTHLCCSIMGVGGIAIGGFLGINYFLAGALKEEILCPIEEKSVVSDDDIMVWYTFNGMTKVAVYSEKSAQKVEDANYMELKIHDGWLGYDVIKHKKLMVIEFDNQ